MLTQRIKDLTEHSRAHEHDHHSRRGLLRRLMTGELDRARRDGYPVALLTATEATIYGRFGFGAATFNREVTVDATTRLQLKAPTVGSVEMADGEAVR